MRLGLAGCLKRSRDFAKQQTWELGIRSWWFHNEGFGQFFLENAICHLAALFFFWLANTSAAWVETNYCQNNSLFRISERNSSLEMGCFCHAAQWDLVLLGGFTMKVWDNFCLQIIGLRVLSAIWPHYFSWLTITSTAWVETNYCENNYLFMIRNEIRPQKWVASVTQLNDTWSC